MQDTSPLSSTKAGLGHATDDPLADIKAAWIMAGEDIKDFTVMKFNKKLREEEKRDFNKNFISGNTDYEEKIDLWISAF